MTCVETTAVQFVAEGLMMNAEYRYCGGRVGFEHADTRQHMRRTVCIVNRNNRVLNLYKFDNSVLFLLFSFYPGSLLPHGSRRGASTCILAPPSPVKKWSRLDLRL